MGWREVGGGKRRQGSYSWSLEQRNTIPRDITFANLSQKEEKTKKIRVGTGDTHRWKREGRFVKLHGKISCFCVYVYVYMYMRVGIIKFASPNTLFLDSLRNSRDISLTFLNIHDNVYVCVRVTSFWYFSLISWRYKISNKMERKKRNQKLDFRLFCFFFFFFFF